MTIVKSSIWNRQGLLLWGWMLVVSTGVQAAESLDAARSAVSRWVDVERTISREALDWEDKRVLLNDMLAVAKAEIESLREGIAAAKKAANAADERRAELVRDRDENTRMAAVIRTNVIRLETRLRAFAKRMPQPLAEKLQPLLLRIPTKADDSEIGVARRMQTVIGIIAEVQRFDRLVTLGEELQTSADGATREVRTVHFGLGASYYVAADDADAGVGVATDAGWAWQSRPELAVAVRAAIAMAEGKQREARFLALPVAVKEVAK